MTTHNHCAETQAKAYQANVRIGFSAPIVHNLMLRLSRKNGERGKREKVARKGIIGNGTHTITYIIHMHTSFTDNAIFLWWYGTPCCSLHSSQFAFAIAIQSANEKILLLAPWIYKIQFTSFMGSMKITQLCHR